MQTYDDYTTVYSCRLPEEWYNIKSNFKFIVVYGMNKNNEIVIAEMFKESDLEKAKELKIFFDYFYDKVKIELHEHICNNLK